MEILTDEEILKERLKAAASALGLSSAASRAKSGNGSIADARRHIQPVTDEKRAKMRAAQQERRIREREKKEAL